MNDSNPSDVLLGELEALMQGLGTWSQSLVLGGGVALIVYDLCMATKPAGAVGTTDMDFLIPRKPMIPINSEPISELLKSQGFVPHLRSVGNPPIESYVKEVAGTDLEVEFLTDDRARKKTESAAIPGAGVVAQPLAYLEMSLSAVTTAKLPRGTEVRVVRPAAWVFHKGLTFSRRKPGSFKRAKDLYGIWFILTMLGDLSDLAWVELKALHAAQPSSWANSFRKNLKGWIEQATPRDWSELVAQDPKQRLTREVFTRLVSQLLQGMG